MINRRRFKRHVLEEWFFDTKEWIRNETVIICGSFRRIVPIISTVDGRNSAPVDMVNIPLFTGCHTCWMGGAGFLPSTVVKTFFIISLIILLFFRRLSWGRSPVVYLLVRVRVIWKLIETLGLTTTDRNTWNSNHLQEHAFHVSTCHHIGWEKTWSNKP